MTIPKGATYQGNAPPMAPQLGPHGFLVYPTTKFNANSSFGSSEGGGKRNTNAKVNASFLARQDLDNDTESVTGSVSALIRAGMPQAKPQNNSTPFDKHKGKNVAAVKPFGFTNSTETVQKRPL